MAGRLGWVRKTFLVILGVGVILTGAAVYVLYPQILKAAPEASYPAPQSAEEANRQDIDYLGRLIEIDRSFSPEAQAAFIAGIAELESRAGSLSPAQLEMEAARLVALADNGHTNVKGVGRGLTLNALPLRIHHFAEGYFVVRARPEHTDLLGAEIVAINGQTPEALLEALAPFVGGPPSLRREFATSMLISPRALAAAGLAERDDRATLTLRLATGEETTSDLAAEATPANGPVQSDPELESLRRSRWPQRDLSPIASPVDGGEWEKVLDSQGALPLYLRDPDRYYWSEDIAALDAVYVQINTVRDDDNGTTLGSFLADVVADLKANPVSNVFIDLRFNAGGDGTLTTDFTQALPGVLPPDGRIFILTSGNTYSAAIITAARLSYFGGDRALIVGEPMGDRERFWAEGRNIFLPNSQLQIGYATAEHDWENGCGLSQILSCYYVNYVIGVPAGALEPDIPVAPRFADYAKGEDTILLAIEALLAAEQP